MEEGAPATHELESLPFPIADALFSGRMALGLSLHNARLRRAPAAMGGGYYDCNSKMGEAHSHAVFAAGLIELERRRGERLGSAERDLEEGVRHVEASLSGFEPRTHFRHPGRAVPSPRENVSAEEAGGKGRQGFRRRNRARSTG